MPKRKAIVKSKDTKIYPIKVNQAKLNESLEKYPLPNTPFFWVLLGRIRSGKSLITQNIALRKDPFYYDDFQVKILISPTASNDAQCQHMIEDFDFVFESYSEELLGEIIDMIENEAHDRKYLLVLDDAISDGFRQTRAGKPDKFSSMITRFRHIGSKVTGTEGLLSIILTVQYWKFLSPIVRNNFQALCICGKFSDSELNKISEQMDYIGGSSKKFLELYKQTQTDKFNFCYVNVTNMEMYRNFDELIWSEDMEDKLTEPEKDELEIEEIPELKEEDALKNPK
tara:strand:+ start:168 stop:1019 length:852 start_codon:yes stop_codon:yes gene_type:complete